MRITTLLIGAFLLTVSFACKSKKEVTSKNTADKTVVAKIDAPSEVKKTTATSSKVENSKTNDGEAGGEGEGVTYRQKEPGSKRAVQPLKIDSEVNYEVYGDHFMLDQLSLDKNILSITVSYSGGCKEHGFELSSNNQYTEETPGIHLLLHHNSFNDYCEAMETETLQFDIKALKNKQHKSIELSINGFDKKVIYSY